MCGDEGAHEGCASGSARGRDDRIAGRGAERARGDAQRLPDRRLQPASPHECLVCSVSLKVQTSAHRSHSRHPNDALSRIESDLWCWLAMTNAWLRSIHSEAGVHSKDLERPCDRRHCPGVIPLIDLNTRVKWLCSEKPVASAISTSDLFEFASRSCA